MLSALAVSPGLSPSGLRFWWGAQERRAPCFEPRPRLPSPPLKMSERVSKACQVHAKPDWASQFLRRKVPLFLVVSIRFPVVGGLDW